ncbi:hypothetical protein [Methylorubrum extorquens]|uniref:hypothetical protein n=1 Tax=Methylorubrum extorquens TaxID=408 RepID=UPI0020A03FA5|nr:hypothetical protein [Methylorubrum extorquens]MCP1539994.1 hypothetical protein [Methylorubrum extorquens]
MTKELDTNGHIIAALAPVCDSRLMQLPGPMSLPVAYNDPNRPFKTMKFKGVEEFLLTGVRLGGRGQVIAQMTAMDTVDYLHAELDGAKLHLFGETESAFVNALATYLAKAQADAELEDLDAPFIASNASLASAVGTFRAAMPELLAALELKREADAKRSQADAYADNPMWGTW